MLKSSFFVIANQGKNLIGRSFMSQLNKRGGRESNLRQSLNFSPNHVKPFCISSTREQRLDSKQSLKQNEIGERYNQVCFKQKFSLFFICYCVCINIRRRKTIFSIYILIVALVIFENFDIEQIKVL